MSPTSLIDMSQTITSPKKQGSLAARRRKDIFGEQYRFSGLQDPLGQTKNAYYFI